MKTYVARRLMGLLFVWLAIATIVFALLRFVPGDPATILLGSEATPQQLEELRVQLGLTRSIAAQFTEWMTHVIQGDLGSSLLSKRPVMDEMLERLPRSLELACLATLVSVLIAIPSGVIAAVRRGTVWDQGLLSVALAGICIPSFVLALLLIFCFSVELRWFPLRGYHPRSDGFLLWLWYLTLPALAYGFVQAAELARMTRSAMIEIVSLDFVRTARSKGLPERSVIYHHALRNALIPIVTLVGINLGVLLSSTVAIEYIFGIPGIGSLLVDAIRNRDYPIVQGVILGVATMYTLLNLIVDVSYTYLDPRIRYR